MQRRFADDPANVAGAPDLEGVGVDEIWFVSLLMADISREKLGDITNDGSRIYVPRDSFVWNKYKPTIPAGIVDSLPPDSEDTKRDIETTSRSKRGSSPRS